MRNPATISKAEDGLDLEFLPPASEEAVAAEIEQARADMRAGRTVPHEEVRRWLDSWGTPDELPPPTCG